MGSLILDISNLLSAKATSTDILCPSVYSVCSSDNTVSSSLFGELVYLDSYWAIEIEEIKKTCNLS